MIEIQAKLLRHQSAVYLSGEKVELFVTFTNRAHPEQRVAQSNEWVEFLQFDFLTHLTLSIYAIIRNIMENLAWASVQILGYVKTHEHRNQLVESQNHNPTTSLHVQDNSFLSTSPKILFCDLKLGKDESKTCKLTLINPTFHSSTSHFRLLSWTNSVLESTHIQRHWH